MFPRPFGKIKQSKLIADSGMAEEKQLSELRLNGELPEVDEEADRNITFSPLSDDLDDSKEQQVEDDEKQASGDNKRLLLNKFKSDASSAFKLLKGKAIDAKHKMQAVAAATSPPTKAPKKGKIFGRPIREVPRIDGIPVVVRLCVDYLLKNEMDLVGIFRVPGSHSEINKIKEKLDKGDLVDFSDPNICKTPHTVAAVLKLYFRELKEPLLTYELYDVFLALNTIDVEEVRLSTLKRVVGFLPPSNLLFLMYLVRFLRTISLNSDVNKMGAANLAMVFAPNLLSPQSDDGMASILMDTGQAAKILELMINEFEHVFGEIDETKLIADVNEEAQELEETLDKEQQQQKKKLFAEAQMKKVASLAVNVKKMVKLRRRSHDAINQINTQKEDALMPLPPQRLSPVKLKGPRSNPFSQTADSSSKLSVGKNSKSMDDVAYLDRKELPSPEPPVRAVSNSQSSSSSSVYHEADQVSIEGAILASTKPREMKGSRSDELAKFEELK